MRDGNLHHVNNKENKLRAEYKDQQSIVYKQGSKTDALVYTAIKS